MRAAIRVGPAVAVVLMLGLPAVPGSNSSAAAAQGGGVAEYTALLQESLDATTARPPDLDRARSPLQTLLRGAPTAAGFTPRAALQPALDDLDDTPPNLGDAAARLHALIDVLRDSPRSAPPHDPGAAREVLRQVYDSPAMRDLDAPARPNWISQVGDAIRRFFERFSPHQSAGQAADAGAGGLNTGIVLVILGLVAIIAGTVWLVLRDRIRDTGMVEPAGTTSDPDVEWDAALDAAGSGDYREAIRRGFRSALLGVARHGRLAIDPSWTTRELLGRASGDAELLASLTPAADGFQIAWYSGVPVREADWEVARERCSTIRALASGTTAAVR